MGSKGNKTLKKDELNKKTLRKVNSTNLKKLGEVSLKEKIQNAVEEHSDEETQAIVLHQSMTPGEKSNAWNQHQTHLKKCGNESLKKDFESLDRKGKGLSTALFLLKKNRAVYAHVSKEAAKETSLKKRVKWKQMPNGALQSWKSTSNLEGSFGERVPPPGVSMNTKTLLTMKKRWWAGRDAPGNLARSMSLGRRMKRTGKKPWIRTCAV